MGPCMLLDLDGGHQRMFRGMYGKCILCRVGEDWAKAQMSKALVPWDTYKLFGFVPAVNKAH